MRYRVVTRTTARDYTDGTTAAVKHCRNVADNATSTLLRLFDDALPLPEPLPKPEVIDHYERSEERAQRSRMTWPLGDAVPAFTGSGVPRVDEPPAETLEPESWRVRAFYYALGQIESMWELSPLVTGDAVSFSYHWQHLVRTGVEPTNLSMREAWVEWDAARRADLEQHGRPKVPALRLPAGEGIDYLAGGEHDPNLGPNLGDGEPS